MAILNLDDKKYLVLNLIRRSSKISRYNISKMTKLSGATVSNIVASLIDDSLVRERGLGISTGGRKPLLLDLNPVYGYIVGVDFEATSIMAVLVDFKLRLIADVRERIRVGDDKLSIVRKINTAIRKLIGKAKVDQSKILGIGVGVPGLIDSQRGVALSYYSLPGWQDVPIKDLIEMEFNIPTYIEKNIRTMALAEKWFGQGQQYDNLLCLGIRSGIGMGIIINGELYRGTSESAGEIGHITVDAGGPRCMCGNRGCLQELASSRAIIARVKKRLAQGEESILNTGDGAPEDNGLTIEAIIKAANQDDFLALGVLLETAEYLGIAISNLIDLFNPQLVVIAGDLVEAGDLILTKLRETVGERALEIPRQVTRITLSQLGENIGAIGATTVVLQEKYHFSLDSRLR